MKKNEKTNDEVSKETVSKTTWRLKSAPSLDDIARALELDLITKEQATEMLVKVEQEEVADPATYNDLKKEIEFLRGLILNIMNNPTTNTIVKYIESYPLRYNPWVQP